MNNPQKEGSVGRERIFFIRIFFFCSVNKHDTEKRWMRHDFIENKKKIIKRCLGSVGLPETHNFFQSALCIHPSHRVPTIWENQGKSGKNISFWKVRESQRISINILWLSINPHKYHPSTYQSTRMALLCSWPLCSKTINTLYRRKRPCGFIHKKKDKS